MRIGDLSAKSRKGRHTTRHVELIPLTGGGLLADAPGFTYLEFQDIDKWTLRDYFREFARYQAECRYADCLHRKEPDPANARYWYNRAGRDPATVSLDQEWEDLAAELLG